MPLTIEMPSAIRFLVPGAVAGVAAFAFSRVMIEPLIGAAVDYEGAREHAESLLAGGDHEHGHELFTRAVQENVGAAVGVVVFGIVMGVLFAVAYASIRAVLERRGVRPDSTGLALLLAAGMFVAIVLMPSLKYPANPPTVGLEDTVGARSSAFLAITVISVVGACVAVAAGLAWSRRWGLWRAVALAVGGYVAVMLCAMALLPSFHEVPGPLSGPGGLVLDGFPAEVLAEFRLYSLVNQALMWLVIGVTWACLAAWTRASAKNDLGVLVISSTVYNKIPTEPTVLAIPILTGEPDVGFGVRLSEDRRAATGLITSLRKSRLHQLERNVGTQLLTDVNNMLFRILATPER